jgi:hypothetical protein
MSGGYSLLRAGFLLPGIALKNGAGSTEAGRKSGRYFSLKTIENISVFLTISS